MTRRSARNARSLWHVFLDRTNFTVTGLTAGAILYTRSAGVSYFASGALVCSLTVKMLKRIFKQPRPTHETQRKVSYGMPSTHSATITYYATYVPLACLYLSRHRSLPPWIPLIVPPLLVVPWAGTIAASRVWLGHHTWKQVAVGCGYGFLFAWAWFFLWTSGGIHQYGQMAEDWAERLLV